MERDCVSIYKDDVGHVPVLTKEEQLELGRLAASGDIAARDKLIHSNLRLAASYALKYRGFGIEYADLIQHANMGLLHAAKRYDPEKNVKFTVFAMYWVKQALVLAIKKEARTVRIPDDKFEEIRRVRSVRSMLSQNLNRRATEEEVAEYLGMTKLRVTKLMEMTMAPYSMDGIVPDCETEEEMTFHDVLNDGWSSKEYNKINDKIGADKMMNGIDDVLKGGRLCDVLRRRHGIREYGGEPHTLEEIGKAYGVTKEYARQLENKAYKMIRNSCIIKSLEELHSCSR